jgi:hypothetical protein
MHEPPATATISPRAKSGRYSSAEGSGQRRVRPCNPCRCPFSRLQTTPRCGPRLLAQCTRSEKLRHGEFPLRAWPEPVSARAHPRGRTRARPCAAAPARPCAAAGTRAHNAHAPARPCRHAQARPCAAARARARAGARALACLRTCLRARGTVPAPAQGTTASGSGLVAVLAVPAPAARQGRAPLAAPRRHAGAAVNAAHRQASHGRPAAMPAKALRPWRPEPCPLAGIGQGERALQRPAPIALARRGCPATAAGAPFVACHAHGAPLANRRQGPKSPRTAVLGPGGHHPSRACQNPPVASPHRTANAILGAGRGARAPGRPFGRRVEAPGRPWRQGRAKAPRNAKGALRSGGRPMAGRERVEGARRP